MGGNGGNGGILKGGLEKCGAPKKIEKKREKWRENAPKLPNYHCFCRSHFLHVSGVSDEKLALATMT
jgi:hypothetical protein